MSTFEGRRTIDGLVVTKDGAPLDAHYDIARFTNWGFEWTYEGASPQQPKQRATVRLNEPSGVTCSGSMANAFRSAATRAADCLT